jgi:alpha-tubulin suppressor-like RCC1 family protein
MPQWKQYSGIWTSTQQAQAVAAETWTGLVFNEFYTWGSNGNGQLGENAVGSLSRSSPTQVGGKDNWDKIVGSGRSSTFFAVKDNGTLWSWGLNSFGVQGHGDTISRSSPVQVGALTNWSEASMDTNHSLAIKTDGTLWVIGGDNDKGQHGLNMKKIYFLSGLTPLRFYGTGGVTTATPGDAHHSDFGFVGYARGYVKGVGRLS